MARSRALAGASGVLRRCSQSRSVLMGNLKASANSTCVMPSCCRSAFTGETLRIVASSSGRRGWASGSDNAAASTSSSVIASTRAQSVSPRGGGSPGFTVMRVVPLLFMSRGPPGGDDAAGVVAAGGRDDEQDVVDCHADDPRPFLAVLEAVVDLLEPVRIFDGSNGVSEIDAVSSAILDGLRGVPLVVHRPDATGYQ